MTSAVAAQAEPRAKAVVVVEKAEVVEEATWVVTLAVEVGWVVLEAETEEEAGEVPGEGHLGSLEGSTAVVATGEVMAEVMVAGARAAARAVASRRGGRRMIREGIAGSSARD